MFGLALFLCLLVAGRLVGHDHNRIGLSLEGFHGSLGHWRRRSRFFQSDNGSDKQQHNYQRQQDYSPTPLSPRHVEKAFFHCVLLLRL
jgi:hypothetical protein